MKRLNKERIMEYVDKFKLKDLKVLGNIEFWFFTIFAAMALVGLVDLLNSPAPWVKAVVAFVTIALLVDKFVPKVVK